MGRKFGPGSENPQWSGGITADYGYVMIQVGEDHPCSRSGGKARLSHLVWVSAHGSIPDGCVVHHINGDRQDNVLSNLEIKSKTDHDRHHSRIKPRDKKGRFCVSS